MNTLKQLFDGVITVPEDEEPENSAGLRSPAGLSRRAF